MPNLDAEVTTSQAAEVLAASVWTVQRLVRSGDLAPSRKLPGRTGAYLFRRDDVLDLAARRALAATPARTAS